MKVSTHISDLNTNQKMQPPKPRVIRIVLLVLLLMILLFLIVSIVGQNITFAQNSEHSSLNVNTTRYDGIHWITDVLPELKERTDTHALLTSDHHQISYTRTMGTNPINSKLQRTSF